MIGRMYETKRSELIILYQSNEYKYNELKSYITSKWMNHYDKRNVEIDMKNVWNKK